MKEVLEHLCLVPVLAAAVETSQFLIPADELVAVIVFVPLIQYMRSRTELSLLAASMRTGG